MRHRKRTGNRFVANPKSGQIFEGWLRKILRILESNFKWEKAELAELVKSNYDDVVYWWDARTQQGGTFNGNYVAEMIDRQFDYNGRVIETIEHMCGTESANEVTMKELREHWHRTRTTGTPHSAGEAAREIIEAHGFPITTDADAEKAAEYLDRHGRQTQPPKPREDNVADYTPDIGVQMEGRDAALKVLGDMLTPPDDRNPQSRREFMEQANRQAIERGEESIFSDNEIEFGTESMTDEADQELPDEASASAEKVLRDLDIDVSQVAAPQTIDD